MRILLTGATGFIGRYMLPALMILDPKNTVSAVARKLPPDSLPSINWIVTDLGVGGWTSELPDQDFDVVVHLAQSIHYREFPDRALDIFQINVGATIELAEWASKHKVKHFLFASTGNVYGSAEQTHIEDDVCAPESMYGASKYSAEILLKSFSGLMNIVILRFFCVYGPGQVNAMLPSVIRQFMVEKEITLAGGFGVRFNPIYVEDCVSRICSLIALSTLSNYEVINIGGSEITDLKQIALLMERFGKKRAVIRVTDEYPRQLVGSIEKIMRLTGKKEETSFQEGLQRTFESIIKLA